MRLTLAFSVLCTTVVGAGAHLQDEHSAVVEATLIHIRQGLPAGSVAITPMSERLRSAVSTALPKLAGAWVTRLEERDTVIACWVRELPTCTVRTMAGAIDVLDATVERDSATVVAGTVFQVVRNRTPAAWYQQRRYFLEKRATVWVVSRSVVIGES